jgi:hypothetical protein
VTDVPLSESQPVILNGAGNGTAELRPAFGETWSPATVSVKVSSAVKEAQCRIYLGSDTTDANFVDGTLSGSTGDSTDRVTGPFRLPNRLFAVWSGGDAGATATLAVSGTRDIA